MDRDQARREALRAIDDEREWQEGVFPVERDDVTVIADLNHMVSVLTKYTGAIACQAVNQVDVKPVSEVVVARNSKKVAAVAVAVIESLLATGRISPDDLREKDRDKEMPQDI